MGPPWGARADIQAKVGANVEMTATPARWRRSANRWPSGVHGLSLVPRAFRRISWRRLVAKGPAACVSPAEQIHAPPDHGRRRETCIGEGQAELPVFYGVRPFSSLPRIPRSRHERIGPEWPDQRPGLNQEGREAVRRGGAPVRGSPGNEVARPLHRSKRKFRPIYAGMCPCSCWNILESYQALLSHPSGFSSGRSFLTSSGKASHFLFASLYSCCSARLFLAASSRNLRFFSGLLLVSCPRPGVCFLLPRGPRKMSSSSEARIRMILVSDIVFENESRRQGRHTRPGLPSL